MMLYWLRYACRNVSFTVRRSPERTQMSLLFSFLLEY
jgi:hypothetical protein